MVAEMGNPHEPGRVSVTLKSDQRDGAWIVFHGGVNEVQRMMVESFGLEEERDTLLGDLVPVAESLYKAHGNAASTLGGRTIKKSGGASNGGSGWDAPAPAAESEPEVDPNVARILAAIENGQTADALRELYARNAQHFTSNPELLAAWQAKGKSLS